ncbi:unnamed protein product [Blumeria hordei]|uniref:Uncharacterized protein n=1 Tax=Blumeria hordei TaxID=2867405 RepID=A0A383URA7_BLUHO|nr:unnamed protein product [Blumeria hordei]
MLEKRENNSFLMSGAVVSPISIPSHLPAQLIAPSINQNHSLMSSPKYRIAFVDENISSLIDDWRVYVQQLRTQFQGERAHMRADRDRAEEIMAGEQDLWDRERELWNTERKALKIRIVELEAQLQAVTNMEPSNSQPSSSTRPSFTSSALNMELATSTRIPQESGRNLDGSPFYAPAPLNPTRTFGTKGAADVPVEEVAAIYDGKIQPSGSIHPINPNLTKESLDTMSDVIESSRKYTEVDGVAIRNPTTSRSFMTNSLSSVLESANISQLKSGITPTEFAQKSKDQRERIETIIPLVAAQPENKRLTLFAGHTPNHSVTKFDLAESEAVSPANTRKDSTDKHKHITQANSKEIESGSKSSSEDSDDGDREFSGPLGLINEKVQDDLFLSQLTKKLAKEAKKKDDHSYDSVLSSNLVSQADISSSTPDQKDEGPKLRMKPSMNFGRPFGSM